ncbi:type III pantothenate kinase [Thiotrichales bacterium HSG1]|nr:type III pantothenate kinase [Thiotrichales bacterium HSG1]
MILLVDIGNSAIKWAEVRQNNLTVQKSTLYNLVDLEQILTRVWLPINKPEAVWISNVAGPRIEAIITSWVDKRWKCYPNFVKTVSYQCGVKNGYKKPEQLGIDRWLALIGVYGLGIESSCVIVDCGTAVTIDVLRVDGQHLGGVIAPGLKMMQTALAQNTHKLTHSNQHLTKFSLANETNDGIIMGTSYAVLGLLEYVTNKLNGRSKLILTGGDTVVIKPFLSKTHQYIPDLVLQGLKTVSS